MTADPRAHLEAAGRRRRHLWRQYDDFRARRGVDIDDWPEWCYCPLAGSYAIVSEGTSRRLSLEEASEIAQIGALAAWRATQGIYRFDPGLAAELVAAEIAGDIPGDVLHRLPEWCVYVELDRPPMVGFWAHLEWDPNDGRSELRLLLDLGTQLLALPIHLGGTLTEGLARADREASMRLALRDDRAVASESWGLRGLASQFAPLVNLVLYLCSTEPDVKGEPLRAKTVRGPRGVRIEPPVRPTVRETGYRIGAALRAAAARSESHGGEGRSPEPHVRRAHWHTYWVGPRDSQRSELRWISPTLVGFGGEAEVAPVVRPVSRPRVDE